MRLHAGLTREIAASGPGRDLDRVDGRLAGLGHGNSTNRRDPRNHALDSSVCGETVVRHAGLFRIPNEIGLALVWPDKVALRLKAELVPKSGGLKGISAWMDGIGPPMLIALQP